MKFMNKKTLIKISLIYILAIALLFLSNYQVKAEISSSELYTFVSGEINARKQNAANSYIKEFLAEKGIDTEEELDAFINQLNSEKEKISQSFHGTWQEGATALSDLKAYQTDYFNKDPSTSYEDEDLKVQEGRDIYTNFIVNYEDASNKAGFLEKFMKDNGITDYEEFKSKVLSIAKSMDEQFKTHYVSSINSTFNSYEQNQNQYQNNDNNSNNSGTPQVSQGITSFADWFKQATEFLKIGSAGAQITTDEAIESFIPLGRILVGIATIVLIAVGGIMGVKYMLAGANDKAQLKQKLIYYVISIVLVYGAVGIFAIVINVMNNILG